MGLRIRQKLVSLGRILAFDAQSPTGSYDGGPACAGIRLTFTIDP